MLLWHNITVEVHLHKCVNIQTHRRIMKMVRNKSLSYENYYIDYESKLKSMLTQVAQGSEQNKPQIDI